MVGCKKNKKTERIRKRKARRRGGKGQAKKEEKQQEEEEMDLAMERVKKQNYTDIDPR